MDRELAAIADYLDALKEVVIMVIDIENEIAPHWAVSNKGEQLLNAIRKLINQVDDMVESIIYDKVGV